MVYDSVYEANNYLRGTVRKQHFWDWFSGAGIPVATYAGYAGGNSSWSSPAGSHGGGGGSSAVGGNASGNSSGGNGGAGTSSSITGSAVTRAGGGGGGDWATSGNGGNGGSGGGGHGQSRNSTQPSAGSVNTGSGGGGAWGGTGGAGGSGIVILRFTTSGNGYSQAGGTVTTSGSDTIITYTSTSGTTFTPTSSFNVEYLVIAGGGGGYNGGGGAGGYRTATGHSVTAQAYTITVGAGGATATNGNDSIFSGITSTGGGTGGASTGGSPNADGHDGGSGGGAGGGGDGSLGVAGNPSPATFVSWTLEQAIGSGNTGAMVDSVDGGYAITPAGVLDGGAITFNDKRQYSYNSSVCIAVCNKIDVGGRYRVGLSEDETLATTYNDTAHCFDGASGNIYLQTANGTAGNDTASNVTANTTTVHGIKIETKSSSVELSIDGVLKVTNTTYLPLTKLQPVFLARGGGGSGNQKSAIRYMEAYNT